MKIDRQKHNGFIDAVLFAGFLAACWLDLTGVELHQWLGMAIGVFALYHLTVHWAWVKAVTTRFFNTTSSQARVCFVVDVALMAGFGLILATGLVISTWLDLAWGDRSAWNTVHVGATVGTLVLVVFKIGLHWRWIVSMAQRYIARPAPVANPVLPWQPAPAAVGLNRREFVKLMGVVGVASIFPMVNALDALTPDPPQPAGVTKTSAPALGVAQSTFGAAKNATLATSVVQPAPGATKTAAPATSVAQPTPGASSAKLASNTCTVRCRKGCSYPGRCRKYVDSNNNKRCDLTECL